ncbi:hypothetical protein GCM10009788_25530 [Nocardioides humi]|uniref:GerMN domain-containing protein n=1 Tax=Nocardioides humi TaxID=449461 RepID=A0ABN2AKY6_9ACTN
MPYRLLEPGTPAAGSSSPAAEPGHVPLVFWLDAERLRPEAARASCADPPEEVVERLLSELSTGPSEEARAAGASSAIPPDSALDLVGVAGGLVTVDIETDTSLSAERLPVAIGQVVLTVASAPTVRSVALVSGGEPIQVPLPGGALTDGPVIARDYEDLLPVRYRESWIGRGLGCRQP